MELKLADRAYALVRRIPKGRVMTYGQIALLLERPRAARMVGQIMSRCEERNVPCHRVVKANGALCAGFLFGQVQRQALLEEGVAFLPDGRVDLRLSRWTGPEDETEATMG